MNLKSLAVMAGISVIGIFSGGVFDKAAAIDLDFSNPVETAVNNNPYGFNLGAGVTSSVIHYTNVASGVDARVTATVSGANYSFVEHIPNYTAAGNSNGDMAFLYQIDSGTGIGGLNYTVELFQSGSNYTTAYVAPDLRFLVYDVDGESPQGEAVRISNNSGLVGYQVGNTAQALIPTQDANGYLFSGRDTNVAETNASGATILYFQNTNTVSFQFEANTRTDMGANPIFSAIDGDLSLIGQNTVTGFGQYVSVGAPSSSTAVPEPFTIIGSIIGGTAAFRMKKKLKSTDKA